MVCAADSLCKLVREAEGFGLSLARDRIGAALASRAAAAKAWLDHSRKVRILGHPVMTRAGRSMWGRTAWVTLVLHLYARHNKFSLCQ